MAKGEVRLIGSWLSPFVIRPGIALNIKSVEYEFLEDGFGSKSQLLLESNPVHKKIPVLIHDSKPICESRIIVEYIDEVWPSSSCILPSDPYERAIARFWASNIDEQWFPNLKLVAIDAIGEEKDKAMEQVKKGIPLLEDAYRKISKGKDFFGGEQIGYIDIAFGSHLGWLKAVEKMNGMKLIDEATAPGLAKWETVFSSHPHVNPLIPEADKLIEFGKVLAAKIKAAKLAKSS